MQLIFGGAYQGKLDYALERFQLKEEDVFDCSVGKFTDGGSIKGKDCPGKSEESKAVPWIDFSGKAVNHLEEFVLDCVRSGVEAREYMEEHRKEWQDLILICTDVSSGVVPCEAELRAWREMTGRLLMYLGKEAKEVTRLFCGIPQKIK